ncbi:MAG: hypothetical protein Q7T33_04175 [Dehalococcoidia bacterium]|nr:hypothetical protein [Dehalococcoidia bacterium]
MGAMQSTMPAGSGIRGLHSRLPFACAASASTPTPGCGHLKVPAYEGVQILTPARFLAIIHSRDV